VGEQVEFRISPGVYDWLILIDHNDDGQWESYLGSREEEVKMNRMVFEANKTYVYLIGEDSLPRQILSNKASQRGSI